MKKILLYILLAFSFVSQAQFTFKPITGSGSGFLIAKVATVADVTIATGLEVGDVIDGVTLASGDAVLVKNNTNGIENGLYRVQPSGAALRASDMLTGTLADAKSVFVQNGSHIGVTFQQTVANCTVGTVAQTWYPIGLQSSVFRTDTVSLQVNTVTFTGFDYASVSNNAQLELQVLFEGTVLNVWKDGQVGAGASLLTKTNNEISFDVTNAFDNSVSTERKQTALWYLRTIKTTGLTGGTVVPLTYGRVNAFVVLPSINFINTGVGTKIPFDNVIYSSGMTPSGTDGFTPSVAGRYKASWLMMNGSEEFLDDGFFHVVQNGVSVGQVRYNMMEAAGVNQCAGFIDVDLVAGIPVYLHYRTAHTAADALAWDAGSYFQLSQLPTAVAPVVNTVADNGENTTITDGQSTSSTTFVDVTGSSFTLPSAGEYLVTYNVFTNNGAAGQGTGMQIATSAGVAVPKSYSVMSEASGGGATGGNMQTVKIPTTGAQTFKLQYRAFGNTSTIFNNNTNTGASGESKITWTKIAGQLPTNITDNTASGYFDIGNMRMQWGTLLFGTSGTPITLPVAFANTNYTVVVSSAAGVNLFVTTGTKTTSNFICITLTNVGSPSNNNPISYYAIGQKP